MFEWFGPGFASPRCVYLSGNSGSRGSNSRARRIWVLGENAHIADLADIIRSETRRLPETGRAAGEGPAEEGPEG